MQGMHKIEVDLASQIDKKIQRRHLLEILRFACHAESKQLLLNLEVSMSDYF